MDSATIDIEFWRRFRCQQCRGVNSMKRCDNCVGMQEMIEERFAKIRIEG